MDFGNVITAIVLTVSLILAIVVQEIHFFFRRNRNVLVLDFSFSDYGRNSWIFRIIGYYSDCKV